MGNWTETKGDGVGRVRAAAATPARPTAGPRALELSQSYPGAPQGWSGAPGEAPRARGPPAIGGASPAWGDS